jgi:hypothetical protein
MNLTELLMIASLFVFVCAFAFVLARVLYLECRGRESGRDILPPTAPEPHKQPIVEAVRFESSIGRSVLEVRIPSKRYMQSKVWQNLELSEESRGWLSPFLNGASEALKLPLLAHLASTHTFNIIFEGAGELMRSRSGEGFRAILVDKDSHRIISQGLLRPSSSASVNGLLLWECAAFIVGRKYLADIDRRLKRIDNGIADIRAFLVNERIGKLQADCKLLSDTADALGRDPSFLFCNPVVQHSIEATEQNASAVVRACLLDLKSIRQNVDKTGPLRDITNVDLSLISQEVSKAVNTLHAANFALSLRICCTSFLGSYMDDDYLKAKRLADVMTLWKLLNEESKSVQVAIREKIDTMSELLSFETTVEAKKERARSETHEFFYQAALALKLTRDEVDSVHAEHSLLATAAVPIELALTVDRGGRVLTAQVANRAA